MSLLDRIAEADVAPTCTCGDFARALALALSILNDEGVYRTGYRNGRRDLIEQQLAEKLQPSAVTARWKRNAHRAWMNDCVCAECAGIPLDGWCTCIYCQQLGWVGEQVLRHGHAPIYRPLTERRHAPWEEVTR